MRVLVWNRNPNLLAEGIYSRAAASRRAGAALDNECAVAAAIRRDV
jgi:hypothetical protein